MRTRFGLILKVTVRTKSYAPPKSRYFKKQPDSQVKLSLFSGCLPSYSATRKIPLKSPNMPHDQAFLKGLVPTKALSFQKAVFVDLWLNSLGESTVRGTQGGEQLRIGCIGRGDVHLLLAACRLLNSLEMKPDVVV